MHEPLGEVGPHSQVRNPLEPERFPHRCMAELGFQPRPLSGSRPSADLLTLAGLGGWDAPAVLRKPEVPLGREHVLSREQQQETVWGWEECVLCPRPLLRALAALTVLGFFFFFPLSILLWGNSGKEREASCTLAVCPVPGSISWRDGTVWCEACWLWCLGTEV